MVVDLAAAAAAATNMGCEQNKSVAATLATATCAPLGTSSVTPVNAQDEPGWETGSGNRMSLRLEACSADGIVPGNLLIGNQQGSVLYPDLDAIIAQFSYSFGK